MKKFFIIFSLISIVFLVTGCDILQTPADEVRQRPSVSSTPSDSSTPPTTSTTTPATTSPTPSSSVSSSPVVPPVAVDTSTWQQFDFKELGFTIQLPFDSKDVSSTYKEDRQNEKLPVSLSNSLRYSYKGFLKRQAGEYAFLGSTSENYVSGKPWELTDANKFIAVGDTYQIGNIPITPIAHVPAQSNLLVVFDASKDYYQLINKSSTTSTEHWYAAVFNLPNNKRFKVALLQFKSQDLSLDQLVAALKTVQFKTAQFPLSQTSNPTTTPKANTVPKHNPNNAPFIVNYSNNPVVCGNSPTGGSGTKWVYSCSDRRNNYNSGETVYGLFRIDNIFKNFRFKTDVYKDGIYQWEEIGEWNTVDPTWGWARNYATPVLTNISAGSWEIEYFVDTGDGFSDSPLATTNFQVNGIVSSPSTPSTPPTPQTPSAPFSYDNNGTICGSQPSGGSWSKWWYTCSNPQTTFYRGQTVYGMIHIDKVYIKHRFAMDVYKDGVYQWPDTSNFNDVDTQYGWNYSFYLPVLSNLQVGNWSVNIYLVRQDGTKQFLKTLTFQIYDQSASQSVTNCTSESSLVTHGEGAQIGMRVCDSHNGQYTISSMINTDGCYPVTSGQPVTITVGSDGVYVNGQQRIYYGSSSARVITTGCYGYGAPVHTDGQVSTHIYQATQPFRVIVGS
jgi:hypothetical protein